MNIELDKIYNCDCLEGLRAMEANSVDLTVTSPPYDNLRTYGLAEDEWNFDKFKPIAEELFRVTKIGGVVVWVVGDSTVDGSESGISFRQARFFQHIGFKLHDTMIYEKNSSSFPANAKSKRYTQIFEYMFVFSKGQIRKDITLIADKKNKWSGWVNWGQMSQYNTGGKEIKENKKSIKPVPEYSIRTNIWKYATAFNDKTSHPAVFPEKLAEDHILTWSSNGDVVLDPFMGSGTTAKMAKINGRRFIGFEKNKEYYEESLARISKYHVGDSLREGAFIDGDLYAVSKIDNEKEEEKKIALWKELTKELEDRFNNNSYSTLKNLKVELSFKSKANDKRIKENINIEHMEENFKAELNEQEKEQRDYEINELYKVHENCHCDGKCDCGEKCFEKNTLDFYIYAFLEGLKKKYIKPFIDNVIKEGLDIKTESLTNVNCTRLTNEEKNILDVCRDKSFAETLKTIETENKIIKQQQLEEEYGKKCEEINTDFAVKMKTCFENPNPAPYLGKILEEDEKLTDKEINEVNELLGINNEQPTPVPKKRGRPKGSKNTKKTAEEK